MPGARRCQPLTVDGRHLSLPDLLSVSRNGRRVSLGTNPEFLSSLSLSRKTIDRALESGAVVYGANTHFGGMATRVLDVDRSAHLQENLIRGLKCSVGHPLPPEIVRAAMLIRANALSRGASGVRAEVIERLLLFLNNGITPVVRNIGSIGASGDLVPLAQIAGALVGLGRGYKVEFDGRTIDAMEALSAVGLERLPLKPKEGLALVNGTSVLTAMAAHCIHDARRMFDLVLGLHALFIQALQGRTDSFDPFVHSLKPHRGQVETAGRMHALLAGSQLCLAPRSAPDDLVQDRYSLRCLAQYLGPVADGLEQIEGHVTTEMNSVDDNPLIDSSRARIVSSGNFLGQYVAVSMDQLRYHLALTAKHMDAQISLLVSPEFSRGLPASLAYDDGGSNTFGLKGLQICGNSILPRLLHLGQPIVPFFPTHAEQFNQNINSQGFNSAVLAVESLDLMAYYLAAACVFAVQAVELRTFTHRNTYAADESLSPASAPLYLAIYEVLNRNVSALQPLIARDADQQLDVFLEALRLDLKSPDSKLFDSCASRQHTEGTGPWALKH